MQMIGYTCKYTPVELLAALGGQPALLNREANAFSHAEALTHNHFCCHAKAVLEECRRDGVRELVLVNCCDSIRRCYDVLRAQGGLDFLFLLDLPHHDDGCAKARLRGELERLAAEYGATGAPPWTKRPSGPPSRPLSPCRTAPSWPSPGRGPGRACWRPCGGSPPCRWPI